MNWALIGRDRRKGHPTEGLVSAGTDSGDGAWHRLSKGVAGAGIIKTRCHSNHFACIWTFNPHDNPSRWVQLFPPLHR